MDGHYLGLDIVDTTTWLPFEQHDDLRTKVGERWVELRNKSSVAEIQYFENHFWRVAVPLAFWQNQMAYAFMNYEIDRLVLPHRIYSALKTPIRTKEDLHRWLRYRLLKSAADSYEIDIYSEKSNPTRLGILARLPHRSDTYA